ncbi:MAG: DUF5004 domain-containing protein [Bacteroidota bacterium]
MKNLLNSLKMLMLLGFLAVSCTPEDFPPIGDRPDRFAQLQATWSLAAVIQTDNDAERKGFPAFAVTQDISNDFPFTEFQLTLNGDGSFSVNQGNSPSIIGGLTSGTWTTDDPDFPSMISFTDGSGSFDIGIGSFAEIDSNALSLKLTRFEEKGGALEAVTTYEYRFTK